MSTFERMIDEHVREYEARAAHMDTGVESGVPTSERPEEVMPANWETEEIEKAGPMGVWDALAIQAEHLVERLEH